MISFLNCKQAVHEHKVSANFDIQSGTCSRQLNVVVIPYLPASLVSAIHFPFAHQLAENNEGCDKGVFSCSGSCGKSLNDMHRCACDESCLYIGDCCFDFFYRCKGGYDLDAALTDQALRMKSLISKTTCTAQYIQDVQFENDAQTFKYNLLKIPMISKCTPNTSKSLMNLCQEYERNAFPALPPIPVIHQGMLYRNIYCSLCNGASPMDVILPEHKFVKSKDIHPTGFSTSNVYNGHDNNIVVIKSLVSMHRLKKACQSTRTCLKALDQCPAEQKEIGECEAYQARIVAIDYNGHLRVLRNLGCAKCNNMTVQKIHCVFPECYSRKSLGGTIHKWTSLFDFVGTTKYISREEGAPDCTKTRCQDGFVLRENGCTYCMHYDRLSSQISFTWTQPAILLMFHTQDAAKTFMHNHGRELINTDPNCIKTMDWLQDIGLLDSKTQYLGNKNACLLLPISYLEEQFYIKMLTSDIILDRLIPGLRDSLHTAYILSFDTEYGVNCENGNIMPNLYDDIMPGNIIESFSMHQNGRYQHRWVPWVFSCSFGVSKEQGVVWELLCVDERRDDFNCSHVNASDLVSCPKIEVQFTANSWDWFLPTKDFTSKQPSELIMTSNQTALVCANKCKLISPSTPKTPDVLIPICYSLSMLCLMITFVIYSVTPPLRNVPGLMLMNLIVALFLAQMSYLTSSYGVFLNYPHWCQFLGATQHYFWMTAFAWMACISVDIYQSLSSIQMSHSDSHKKWYYKLAVVCWLTPCILPITTLCFQLSDFVDLGYGGQHTCWLINARSVLYLFVVPVLSVVFFNVTMFLGCVHRIRQISNNACYVGRKEDGKIRLRQCIKISSWVGISWLFGILPNIINRPELWYMFIICNAFQGVQIFLAFGLSKRSRQLLCVKKSVNTDEPTVSTMAHSDYSPWFAKRYFRQSFWLMSSDQKCYVIVDSPHGDLWDTDEIWSSLVWHKSGFRVFTLHNYVQYNINAKICVTITNIEYSSLLPRTFIHLYLLCWLSGVAVACQRCRASDPGWVPGLASGR